MPSPWRSRPASGSLSADQMKTLRRRLLQGRAHPRQPRGRRHRPRTASQARRVMDATRFRPTLFRASKVSRVRSASRCLYGWIGGSRAREPRSRAAGRVVKTGVAQRALRLLEEVDGVPGAFACRSAAVVRVARRGRLTTCLRARGDGGHGLRLEDQARRSTRIRHSLPGTRSRLRMTSQASAKCASWSRSSKSRKTCRSAVGPSRTCARRARPLPRSATA